MTVNIDDDDDYQLTVSPQSVPEGGGAKTVTVTATNVSGAALAEARKINVQVGASGDGAVEGTDYQTVNSFDVTIPKGSSSGTGTFTLTPINDAHLEAGERITLSGSGSSQINGGTLTPRVRGAGLWITDNETIALSATPDVTEDGGTQSVTVTATASGTAQRTIPLTISVGKSGDTAVSGTDYNAVSDVTLTIPSGSKTGTATVRITPVNDTTQESDETITISGSAGEYGLSSTITDTGVKILDNDVLLALSPASVGEEGGAQSVTVTARVKTARAASRALTVSVGKLGDQAVSGTDYGAVTDFSLTIAANQVSGTATFTFTPRDDTIIEGSETLTVHATGTGVDVNSATLTMTETDRTDFVISLNPSTVAEGVNWRNLVVTVSTTDGYTVSKAVTCRIANGGGSANWATEYYIHYKNKWISPPGTPGESVIPSLTIDAGKTSGSLTVRLKTMSDNTPEGDETVQIKGGTLNPTWSKSCVAAGVVNSEPYPADLTITDDDGPISLSTSPGYVWENSPANVDVTATMPGTLAAPEDTLVTVSVGDSGDAAVEGTDYTAVDDFYIKIPKGKRSAKHTLKFSPIDDDLAEGTETVSLDGTADKFSVSGATLDIDDDEALKLTLSASPDKVKEDGGAKTVTVTAALPGSVTYDSDKTVTVRVGTSSDSATEGTDYATVANFSFKILANSGSGSGTFTLTPTHDTTPEKDESISVTGYSPGFTVKGTSITLKDVGVPITLAASPASVTENGGAKTVTVTATNSKAATSDIAVTISVGESGDSATSGTDYTAVDDFTITIKKGATSGTGTFTLTPVNDTLYEGTSESLTVGGSATGYKVSDASVAITDDDPETTVSLSVKPTRVKECSAGTSMTVTAELPDDVYTLPEDRKIKLSVGKTGDGATSGTDYTAVDDFTLTIPAGQHTGLATFTLTPTDDTEKEGDETFTVHGTATRLAVGNDAVATIEDDDQPIIILTMDPKKIPEQEQGKTTTVTVTASLWTGTDSCASDGGGPPDTSAAGATGASGASAEEVARSVLGPGARPASSNTDQTVAVTIGDTGDTALSGTDYTAVTGFNVTIKAGQTKGTATFSTRGILDSLLEPPETLTVKGSATGTTVTPTKGSVDDKDSAKPSLTLSPSSVSEGAAATSVTVTLDTGGVSASKSLDVPFKVSSGTAASGTDFADVADFEAVLKAGETSVSGSFTLTPTDDTVIEGDETIKVSVPGANPAVEATLTLTDDDSTDITLAASLSSVAEADSAKTVTVTASTDGDTFVADRAVTVSVGASGDGATSGTDYAAVTDFDIIISAGLTSGTGTFTLTPTQDTIIEGDETITVGGTSTGLTVNSDNVTLTDDDSTDVTLRVSPSSVVENGGAATVTVTAATDGDTFSGDRTVTVSMGDSSDSAASGTDYAAVTDFDVTISAGDTSGSADFTLTPTQDTIIEGDETISVDGTSTGLTVNGASVTLGDDDSTEITLSVNPASVSEAASGTSVTVTAATDGDTFKTARTVSVTVGNSSLDSATPGTDYAAVTGFDIAIPAGQSSATGTFTLTPTQDTTVEGDETISADGTSTGLAVNATNVTLADDDSTEITLTANPASVSEAASGTSVTVTAATDGGTFATDRTVTVTVGDSSDSADSGTDYAAVTDFDITINRGKTSGAATFTLTPTQDRIIEGEESITVGGTLTGVTVNSDTVTLTDDDSTDTTLKVTVPNQTGAVKVPEGAEATTATVTVSTDGDTFKTDRTVTVSVGASGDGATSGIDYAAVADLDITIAAGDTSGSGTFVITPKQDTLVEGDEGISVSGTSTGLKVNGDSVTIVDDDTAPKISLSANPSSVSEGASATSVTVTATFSSNSTYPVAKTVSVTVGGSADSATSGTDYAAVTGFDITISAGQSSGSASFTLTPKDDTLVEGGETISVDGTSTGLTVNGGSVTLSDDDDAPAINLSANPSSVSEGAAATSVTVTAGFSNTNTYAADKTVTVTVGDSGDSATSGTDYSAVTDFDIVIKAGGTSATGTFTLTPTDDTLVEGNESLSVDGAATGMTVNGGSVTLTDDDGAPVINLSVNPSSVSEGASATSVTVTAAFSSSSTYGAAKTVSVTVGGSGDSATSGTDYAAVSDFDVTIAAGKSSGTATFTLTPVGDSLVEGNETLSLSGTSDLTVNGASVTLTDDDGAPAINLSVNPSTVSEGAAATTVTVTAAFSNSSTYGAAKTVTVTVGDSGDSATSGTDYSAVTPFDLTIAAGKSSGTATFTLTPTGDTVIEGNETLSLAGTSSDLTVNGASMTLTDDDSTGITLSLDPSSVKEDDSATKVVVTARTDGDTFANDRTVRIKVGLVSDSATSGKDYAAVTAFDITITAGDTSGTGNFTLTLTDDNIIEGEEAISVSGTSTGLTVNAAGVTIEDNDEPKIILDIKPFLDTDPDKLPESAGATRVTVTAGTTGGVFELDRQIHVTVGKDGDTAVFGPDYDTPSVAFHVLIKEGETEGEKTFTLTPADDILVEGDESLTLQGSAAGLEITEATITIKDNDDANMTLSASPVRVSEDAGATVVTVTASTGGVTFTADRTVTVTVGRSGDSAAAGIDYAAVAAFDIPITAGQMSAAGTFTLTPREDSIVEGNESITLSGAATGLTVAETGITITDNDGAPSISLSVDPSSVGEGDGATQVTVTAVFSGGGTFATGTAVAVSVGGSGTADSGTDYAAVSDFTVTIAAHATIGAGTFTFTPFDDNLVEGNETVGVSGSALGLTVNGTDLTLADDDSAASVSLSASPSSVDEGSGATEVTVTASFSGGGTYDTDTAVTVSVGGSGTADSGADYAAVSDFTVTIAAFAASGAGTFTLTPVDDNFVEGDETIGVSGSAAGLAVNGARLTLTDDDSAVVSVSDASALEGNTLTFTASLNAAVKGGFTLHVDLHNETTSDHDCSLTDGHQNVVFSGLAGETRTFTVETVDDSEVEGDESFTLHATLLDGPVAADGSQPVDVEASSGGLAVAVSSPATGVIIDDDSAPGVNLSLNPSSLGEGDSATQVTVTAAFSNGSTYATDTAVTVSVGGSGTADSGADYTQVSDFKVTIAANSASGTGTFTLTPADDRVVEGNETVGVSGSAAGLSVTGADLTLTDDDARAVIVSLDRVSVAEDGGTADYTVVLGSQPTGAVIVKPSSASDAVATVSAALTFTATDWSTPQTVTVTGVNDDIDNDKDRNATISHAVSGGDYGGVAAADVAVTVADDDARAVIVSAERVSVDEDGGTADYTVALGSQPTGAVTVTPSSGDASVAAVSGALTFTATDWSTPQTVTVTGVDDDIDNDTDRESRISHTVSGGGYGGMAAADVAVTVVDDDARAVVVSVERVSVDEDGGTADYTVVLGSQPTGAVTVTPSSGDASVAAVTGALTFTASDWSVPQTVTVTGVNDDIDNDPDRETRISHAVSGGDYGGVPAAEVAVTALNDDAIRTAMRRSRVLLAETLRAMSGSTSQAIEGRIQRRLGSDQSLFGRTAGSPKGPSKDSAGGSATGSASGSPARPSSGSPAGSPAGASTGSPAGASTGTPAGASTGSPAGASTGLPAGRLAGASAGSAAAPSAGFANQVAELLASAFVGSGCESAQPPAPGLAELSAGRPGCLQAGQGSGGRSLRPIGRTIEQAFAGLVFWATADRRTLSGREESMLSWDGAVNGLHAGFDQTLGENMLWGLAVSRHTASVGYDARGTGRPASGTQSTRAVSAHPYVAMNLASGGRLWASAGWGSGEWIDREDSGARYGSDMSWTNAVAGGALPIVIRGAELEAVFDASTARLAVEDDELELDDPSLGVSRVRAAFQGQRQFVAGSGSSIDLGVRLGLRYDGGDGQTGMGVETGLGAAWSMPSTGLRLGVEWSLLLAHQGELNRQSITAYIEREPVGQRGSGLSFRLAPSLGADAMHAGTLFDDEQLHGLGGRHEMPLGPRIDAEVGYGFERFALSPFARISAGGEDQRSIRTGLNWATSGGRVNWALEIERMEMRDSPPATSFQLRFNSQGAAAPAG